MNYVPAPRDALPEAENTFFLRGQPSRIGKLLAHYELYKEITAIPGDLLELGVYKGASLARFCAFRSLLENDFSRAIHGFDAFGAFPRSGVESEFDQAFIDQFEGERGEGIARGDLEEILADKAHRNVHLHEGNIFETVPVLLARDPSLKIALLHLDVDVYEPTAFALEHLVPRMARGGLILFDDYGMVEGATRAGDELAERLGLRFEKLSLYAVPSFLRMP